MNVSEFDLQNYILKVQIQHAPTIQNYPDFFEMQDLKGLIPDKD